MPSRQLSRRQGKWGFAMGKRTEIVNVCPEYDNTEGEGALVDHGKDADWFNSEGDQKWDRNSGASDRRIALSLLSRGDKSNISLE
jgi:hypothetical protein